MVIELKNYAYRVFRSVMCVEKCDVLMSYLAHEEFAVTFGRIVGFEFKGINGIGARYGIVTGVVLVAAVHPVASLSW